MPVGMGDIFGHWMAGVYTVGSRPYPYEGRMNTAPAMVLEKMALNKFSSLPSSYIPVTQFFAMVSPV